MISTGNDIVALAATDKDRTCQYRFYSRILSRSELPLYDRLACGGLSFQSFVWLLWSVKESVYKYVSRSDHGLAFAPLKITVSRLRLHDEFCEGMIRHEQAILYSRSFLRVDTILTVVSKEKDFSLTRWGLHTIGDPSYTSQSARVRTFALQSLSTVLSGAALRIVKTADGPPEVWDGDCPLNIPLSLAHHGRYVAWSYRLPANSSWYRKSEANWAASSHLPCVNLLAITGLNRLCSSCEYPS
jgi:phosphopantetheinyl transferase (holo-ACP synthase)